MLYVLEWQLVLTSEVVATNVVKLGVLNQAPDLRLLQMVEVVVVGSTKIRAQAAVVAGDDNTAAASLLSGFGAVFDTKASGLDSIVQDGRVLVVASTTQVDDAVGGKDILGATSRVLSSTASNELSIVVVQEILVERGVLLLGEDGVIGLETILVQKSLVAKSLNIWK